MSLSSFGVPKYLTLVGRMTRGDEPDRDAPIDFLSDGNNFASIRARLHRLADTVQKHELDMREHHVQIGMLFDTIKGMASANQLQNAVTNIELKIVAAGELMDSKVTQIHEDVAGIKKVIWWAVTVVLGSVILAVMALILKKP